MHRGLQRLLWKHWPLVCSTNVNTMRWIINLGRIRHISASMCEDLFGPAGTTKIRQNSESDDWNHSCSTLSNPSSKSLICTYVPMCTLTPFLLALGNRFISPTARFCLRSGTPYWIGAILRNALEPDLYICDCDFLISGSYFSFFYGEPVHYTVLEIF